jgi:Flp pilus assembly protein TadD
VRRQEAAREGLAYLRQAETALRPTSAFYRIRAACRKELGQHEEAGKDLERAREAPAAIALDHYLLALAAADARNKAEAVRQFEAALRAEPTHYWSLLGLGSCLCNLGDREQDFVAAAAAFTGCILKRPDHACAYFCRGNAYRELRRTREAVAEYRAALRLRPDYPEAHVNLGLALSHQGKDAQAEAEYRTALRLRPECYEAHGNLGVALYKQGKLAEAEAEHRAALRLRPGDPMAHVNLGVTLIKVPGKMAEAEAEVREALRLRPDLPEGHHVLGAVREARGKAAEAEAEYREALRLRPNFPAARNNLGVALYKQGKLAQAEAEHRAALRLRPNFPEAHHNLGFALYGQGKPAEAEAEYRRALRLRPDYFEAHLNLGKALEALGKLAGAEAEYREALRLRPNDPVAHNNLSSHLRAQGKLAEAEAHCRAALRQRPNYSTARINLGITLLNQGKPAGAEAEFRKALRLRPDWPDAHVCLGLALQQQGRFTEALGALKRGHELGSRQPNWPYPSAEWVRKAEQLVALDAKLSEVIQGKAQPADAAERLALARLCQTYKKRYAVAARFYSDAFAADPKLAGDMQAANRYNAARAAARAGCGAGEDGPELDEKERARLRQQALSWLRADLAAWARRLEKDPAQSRAMRQALRRWQQDADFASVRGDALAKLGEAERQPWQELWADVQRTLMKTTDKHPRDTKTKSSD